MHTAYNIYIYIDIIKYMIKKYICTHVVDACLGSGVTDQTGAGVGRRVDESVGSSMPSGLVSKIRLLRDKGCLEVQQSFGFVQFLAEGKL